MVFIPPILKRININLKTMFIDTTPFERDYNKEPLSINEQKDLLKALLHANKYVYSIQEYLPPERFGVR
jgi:hypothetical protein